MSATVAADLRGADDHAGRPGYVPQSVGELAGYLASVVEHAAQDHPDDEGLARGVAAWEAWKAAQTRTEDGGR